MSEKVKEAPESAKWWASLSDEWFTGGPFDTRDQAIEEGEGLAIEAGQAKFWVAHAAPFEISFDAQRIIESQYFENEDLFSCEYGIEPDRLDGHEAADAELQELLKDWIARHSSTFVQPTLFSWCRTEHVQLSERAILRSAITHLRSRGWDITSPADSRFRCLKDGSSAEHGVEGVLNLARIHLWAEPAGEA